MYMYTEKSGKQEENDNVSGLNGNKRPCHQLDTAGCAKSLLGSVSEQTCVSVFTGCNYSPTVQIIAEWSRMHRAPCVCDSLNTPHWHSWLVLQ